MSLAPLRAVLSLSAAVPSASLNQDRIALVPVRGDRLAELAAHTDIEEVYLIVSEVSRVYDHTAARGLLTGASPWRVLKKISLNGHHRYRHLQEPQEWAMPGSNQQPLPCECESSSSPAFVEAHKLA
jgi:hypothetical protein